MTAQRTPVRDTPAECKDYAAECQHGMIERTTKQEAYRL